MVGFLHALLEMVSLVSILSTEFQPGDLIDGRYRIVRKLADGGMGIVFLAEHMLIRRRVAIKLLHAELAPDRWMVRRFLNEAAAAGTLGHPHIVESTDMGFTREGVPYIVFEYLQGCLLSEEIRRLGRLPVRRAMAIARQIASALEVAHLAQIAHLDVKGDNVFLTSRGTALDHAKLIDFGISRFMASDCEKTPQGILMGTPEYMAPEQATTPDIADGRADIYALGVVIYEMLAGRCPFEGDDPRWLLQRVIHEPPPALDREIPVMLERLLFDGLLVKSPDRRVQTMAEVVAILDVLIATMRAGIPASLDTFDDPHGGLGPPVWSVDLTLGDPAPAIDPAIDLVLDPAVWDPAPRS